MSAAKAERLEIRLIALDNIRVDHELQSRAAMHKEYEREFMLAMLRGDQFPPVHVFWDGNAYWLADGFHRYGATKAAHIIDIRCEVHYGTRRDAIIFSAGCNKEFSIRRTEEDKRKAACMLFADEEWFRKSADLIAKHVGVTGGTITTWRAKWCEERGRRPPRQVVTARGTMQVASPRKEGQVWRDESGTYWARIGKDNVRLKSRTHREAQHEMRAIRHERQEAAEWEDRADAMPGTPPPRTWTTEDVVDYLRKQGLRAIEGKPSGYFWRHLRIDTGIDDCHGDRIWVVAVCINPFNNYRGIGLVPDAVGQLALLEAKYLLEGSCPAIRRVIIAEWGFELSIGSCDKSTAYAISPYCPARVEVLNPDGIVARVAAGWFEPEDTSEAPDDELNP
jgi:hypothetical protein